MEMIGNVRKCLEIFGFQVVLKLETRLEKFGNGNVWDTFFKMTNPSLQPTPKFPKKRMKRK